MIDEKIVRSKGFTQHQLRRCIAGFTLIELIIVISVLAILSVVGIAAFSSYSRAQTLNAAAGGLSVTLNLAKSRAYSQVKPQVAGCDDNNPLSGYEVRICGIGVSCFNSTNSTSNRYYELDVKCGNSLNPTATITVGVLPLNLSFDSASQAKFFFPVLRGSVVGNGNIIIKNTFNETKTVTVDSSGNIK